MVLAIIAASVIAALIAGGVDFANNVVDLGNKIGIELKLPSAP